MFIRCLDRIQRLRKSIHNLLVNLFSEINFLILQIYCNCLCIIDVHLFDLILTWNLRWPPSQDNISIRPNLWKKYFKIIIWNNWTIWKQTWMECLLDNPIQNVCDCVNQKDGHQSMASFKIEPSWKKIKKKKKKFRHLIELKININNYLIVFCNFLLLFVLINKSRWLSPHHTVSPNGNISKILFQKLKTRNFTRIGKWVLQNQMSLYLII